MHQPPASATRPACDVDAIVAAVRLTGDETAAALRDTARPVGQERMFDAFRAVDGPASARLRERLAGIDPQVVWADEDELDPEARPTAAQAGRRWVCDAIDGAVQALTGIPAWATTLTLVEDGRPRLAVVYAPYCGELYHAVEGRGAYLNGAPIAPAGTTALADALVAHTHVPFHAEHPADVRRTAESLGAVLPRVFAVRNLGPTSLQLAWVAAGRLDAFWEFGADLHNWLAGVLLAEEAGAVVSGPRGEAFTSSAPGVCVAAPGVHRELVSVLTGIA